MSDMTNRHRMVGLARSRARVWYTGDGIPEVVTLVGWEPMRQREGRGPIRRPVARVIRAGAVGPMNVKSSLIELIPPEQP